MSTKKEYPKSLLLDNSAWNYIKKKEVFSGVRNLTIVTPSNWLADLVSKSFLKEYAIKVINNGIDLSIFKFNENNFRKDYKIENKFIILGVANIWSYRKGFEAFLELSLILKEDEVIVLVGLSEQQLKEIPYNIIGIKKTNSVEELSAIYSSSDVFVNPTLEDNFPTVNLEALACGTPVITFDTGGSSESVDNNTGLVVKDTSSENLYKRINLVKKRSKQYYQYDCLTRASSLYNKSDRYLDYVDLYKMIKELQ